MSLLSTPILKALAHQLESGESKYRWLDIYAADFIVQGLTEHELRYRNELACLILELSLAASKGQTFISLDSFAQESGFLGSRGATDVQLVSEFMASGLAALSVVTYFQEDNSDSWDKSLLQHSERPLVLHGQKLYLARYWNLQVEFDQWLAPRVALSTPVEPQLEGFMRGILRQVFRLNKKENPALVDSEEGQPNWQAVAAAHTLLQDLTLIAGGPGTGKTTTAASLLYIVDQAQRFRSGRSVSVRLLAPTGKAAVRLAESIRAQLVTIEQRVEGADNTLRALSESLPSSGETIHRFLYQHHSLPGQSSFGQNLSTESLLLGEQVSRQTTADIIVVDESSMIDLALMVALIKTIPSNTQFIMMGDPFQLPPVEAGEVFSDCVKRYRSIPYSEAFAENLSRLTGYSPDVFDNQKAPSKFTPSEARLDSHPLCYLQKTYRFGGDLKRAAELINAGRFERFVEAFSCGADETALTDVRWWSGRQAEASLPASMNPESAIKDKILAAYLPYFQLLKTGAELVQLSEAFSDFQLLCTTHEGESGVAYMNAFIEQQLMESHVRSSDARQNLYHGKALLITRNHTELGVFNGDIGFVIESAPHSGEFSVCVPQGEGEALTVSPKRLKEWQPAYAMTVHKSQGSEYRHVGLLLADYAKELLSRSLLYTGLTRSKKTCDIWSDAASLERAFKS